MCAKNRTKHQGGQNCLSQRMVVTSTQDDPHMNSYGLQNRKNKYYFQLQEVLEQQFKIDFLIKFAKYI